MKSGALWSHCWGLTLADFESSQSLCLWLLSSFYACHIIFLCWFITLIIHNSVSFFHSPACIMNLSHHRLSSTLNTASMDCHLDRFFWTTCFLLFVLFTYFFFSWFHVVDKTTVHHLSGTRVNILCRIISYCIIVIEWWYLVFRPRETVQPKLTYCWQIYLLDLGYR